MWYVGRVAISKALNEIRGPGFESSGLHNLLNQQPITTVPRGSP